MAYRQNRDPYYNTQPQQRSHYPEVPDYPPQNPVPYNEYDTQSNWDAKSYQSNYTGSQAHLNPYEMSQVSVHGVPPVPAIPYQPTAPYQPNYPPAQARPGMYSNQSVAGYSLAREQLMKRRSLRQVELQNGNLVLDIHVPSHIVPRGMSDVEEMTKLRYTAATCDPDHFMSSKYSLRPYLYGRKTELFIVMTMYNEDEVLFTRTMNA